MTDYTLCAFCVYWDTHSVDPSKRTSPIRPRPSTCLTQTGCARTELLTRTTRNRRVCFSSQGIDFIDGNFSVRLLPKPTYCCVTSIDFSNSWTNVPVNVYGVKIQDRNAHMLKSCKSVAFQTKLSRGACAYLRSPYEIKSCEMKCNKTNAQSVFHAYHTRK